MPRNQTAKSRSTDDRDLKASEPIDMSVLVAGGPEIEAVGSDADIRQIAEDEKFMNEKVEIRFHDTGDQNAPKMIELGVNILGTEGKPGGKSDFKGFLRGKWYIVPRYLVEAAAHAKFTKLEQRPNPNPANPEPVNVETHSFCYPFEVRNDPNPRGRAWLDARLADPI